MTDGSTQDLPSWNDDRFRHIDGSVRTALRQVAVAVLAMVMAFAAAQAVFDLAEGPQGAPGLLIEGCLFALFGCIAIFITSARPIRAALIEQRRVMAAMEERLRTEAARHRFSSETAEALEMIDSEAQAVDVVARTLGTLSNQPGEFLIADASRAHLRQVASHEVEAGCGCGVVSPWSCPAVRRGHTAVYKDSQAISACPKLAERGAGLAAVCVPVTILGTPMGVVRSETTQEQGLDHDAIERLETLARHAGSRIGVLRAMATTELQAATDPLTGAFNRRSLEDQISWMSERQQPYGVLMADLDHFKRLNDTHGHGTGDRALRLFVDVMRDAVRIDDVICRYGGEEFVVLLPGGNLRSATRAAHTVRSRLSEALDAADIPRFTASFGVADSVIATSAEHAIRLADQAMYQAKRNGRDMVVTSGQSDRSLSEAPAPSPATTSTT